MAWYVVTKDKGDGDADTKVAEAVAVGTEGGLAEAGTNRLIPYLRYGTSAMNWCKFRKNSSRKCVTYNKAEINKGKLDMRRLPIVAATITRTTIN